MNHNMAAIKNYLLNLQDKICFALQEEDPDIELREDVWRREQGGGGCTRALTSCKIIEKAGVNFSHVWGEQLPPTATVNRKEIAGATFQALGLSVIVHPRNPFIPTCHANLRFFLAEKSDQEAVWWFGGGFDLTPYYGFVEDCLHWHRVAKRACDPFGKEVYATYKKNADDYFFIKHRNEPRGIGGLFFDDVQEWGFEKSFAFVQSVGDHFLPAYIPLVKKRKALTYGQRERDFQRYRRGRYVEFNLVYDRGTLFGLESGGRIESILISLPAEVSWKYDWRPEPGSPEDKLYTEFLVAKDWIDE